MKIPVYIVAHVAAAVALFWMASMIFTRMLKEVNQNLPPENQYPVIMVPGRGLRIVSEHRRMYPRSRLRVLANSFAAAGLMVFLISIWKAAGISWP